jgi:hypothetical protein
MDADVLLQDGTIKLVGDYVRADVPHLQLGSTLNTLVILDKQAYLSGGGSQVLVEADGASLQAGNGANWIAVNPNGTATISAGTVQLGVIEGGNLKYGLLTQQGSVTVQALPTGSVSLTGQYVHAEAPVVQLGHSEAGSFKYGLTAQQGSATLQGGASFLQVDQSGLTSNAPAFALGQPNHGVSLDKDGTLTLAGAAIKLNPSTGGVQLQGNLSLAENGKIDVITGSTQVLDPATHKPRTIAVHYNLVDLVKRVATLEQTLAALQAEIHQVTPSH